MRGWVSRYADWLHLRWPAGTVEKLPEIREDGSTRVPGVYVVGDLTGIPLLKFSADSGARAVRTIAEGSAGGASTDDGLDLIIVGAGVAGMSAALEARRRGLAFAVYEAAKAFQTIADFPRRKPIYTYPREMTPEGDLKFTATVKEALLDELQAQTEGVVVTPGRVESVRRAQGAVIARFEDGNEVHARAAVVAIGRSGNFRKLDVPGEESDKVYNRLHDPGDFRERNVLVVGGGDSAVESAIALDRGGAKVTLAYRGRELSRPKPENVALIERAAHEGSLRIETETEVRAIEPDQVVLERGGESRTIPNDVVFSMIGREPPLDFFRRSGIRVLSEWTPGRAAGLALFVLFCFALYNWKSGGFLESWNRASGGFPFSVAGWFPTSRSSLIGVLRISASGPSFYYTLAYSLLVVVFGVRRIRRRKTPYVKVQTLTLMMVQVFPLFLLPELLLPWLDVHGWLPAWIADPLFPQVGYGHGREFWRAYGLILAWPLNVYNVFTDSPNIAWLVICFLQTFVAIPTMIYFWGKGAYCGWICSCGALAETLGDTQRTKMPHGPRWNRLNLAGQVLLLVAFVLLLLRVVGWIFPELEGLRRFNSLALWESNLGWKWMVDVLLAGIVGYGAYFWYSGRVWCRFFCPLAALMHIYARFSRFRILADKKKCISCNVCTSVCHQGIDVMNFANKGHAMADPECVRCSACVGSCPTGVLTFGQVDRRGAVIRTDRLPASLVQIREG